MSIKDKEAIYYYLSVLKLYSTDKRHMECDRLYAEAIYTAFKLLWDEYENVSAKNKQYRSAIKTLLDFAKEETDDDKE